MASMRVAPSSRHGQQTFDLVTALVHFAIVFPWFEAVA